MKLKDYTTEELRAELKRRRTKAIREAKKEPPKYKEFTATIKDLDFQCGSVSEYTYGVTDVNPRNNDINSELFNNIRWKRFGLKANTFNKETAPKIGDKVLLRYRRHKTCQAEIFDFTKAKIVEVLERSNNE